MSKSGLVFIEKIFDPPKGGQGGECAFVSQHAPKVTLFETTLGQTNQKSNWRNSQKKNSKF